MSRKHQSIIAILVFLFSSLLSQFGSVASAQQLGCPPVRDLVSRNGWNKIQDNTDGSITIKLDQPATLPDGYQANGDGRKILVNSTGNDRIMTPGFWSVYDDKCIGGLPAQSAAPATSVTFVQPQSVTVVPDAGTLPSLPAQPSCMTGEQLAKQNGWKILEVLSHGGAKVELPTPDTKVPDGYIVHKDPGAKIASIYPPETNECRLSLGLPPVRPVVSAPADLTPIGDPEEGLCLTGWDLAERYGWKVIQILDFGGAVVERTNNYPMATGFVVHQDPGATTFSVFPPESNECRDLLGLPRVRPIGVASIGSNNLGPAPPPEVGICMTGWDLADRYGWDKLETPASVTRFGGQVVRITNNIPPPRDWIFDTDGSGVGTLFPPATQQCRGSLGVQWR